MWAPLLVSALLAVFLSAASADTNTTKCPTSESGYKCNYRCFSGYKEQQQHYCKDEGEVCCLKDDSGDEDTGDGDATEEESGDITCGELYGSDTHTACLNITENRLFDMTSADKDLILKLHNEYRAEEKAADMLKMTWDDEIAQMAAKWAANCEWKHDAYADRLIPWRFGLGQNLMYHTLGSKPDWNRPIVAWAKEKTNFKYGNGSINGGMVGHFTQLVWAKSALVGCAVALCPRYGYFYACNYGESGNIISSSSDPNKPYTLGKPASLCRKKTKINKIKICRCSLACHYRGTLDFKKCRCKCPKVRHVSEKRGQCVLNCKKAKDSLFCNYGQWIPKNCNKYYNIPLNCPIMCGACRV